MAEINKGSFEYLESMMMYYMPGFDQRNATDKEWAMRAAHLLAIRKDESKRLF